ncbi:MAG: DUF3800 domain-containing protein [Rhodomicrobium sp.]
MRPGGYLQGENMPRIFIFGDEAGCFEFSRKQNVSRYFVICTINLGHCEIGHHLLELRRKLVWDGKPVGDFFHATTDKQEVRDEVFQLISQHQFDVYATILEKSKAQPQVRASREVFYQYGWFYHFRWSAPLFITPQTDLMITAASVGTKKGQAVFTTAVNNVVQQVLHIRRNRWQTHFCQSMADPCLQIADYCTWAVQRKWERGDDRSYHLIHARIRRERDLWEHGQTHYY